MAEYRFVFWLQLVFEYLTNFVYGRPLFEYWVTIVFTMSTMDCYAWLWLNMLDFWLAPVLLWLTIGSTWFLLCLPRLTWLPWSTYSLPWSIFCWYGWLLVYNGWLLVKHGWLLTMGWILAISCLWLTSVVLMVYYCFYYVKHGWLKILWWLTQHSWLLT